MALVIVLDVDDTVYLERDYVRSGFEALTPVVLERLSFPAFGDVAWQLFEGGERGNIFDRVLEGRHPPPGFIEELVQRYRSHRPTIKLANDTPEFLQWAEQRGLSIAVLTDGDPASQHAKLEVLGILERTEVVIITDALGGPHCRKPESVGFHAVMSHFGTLPPSSFVYLADNPGKDLAGSYRVGWDFIRVRRPGGIHYRTPSPDPKPFEVASLNEASAILDQRLKRCGPA